MSPPEGWTVSSFPSRWDLLFNFDDLNGPGRWYRVRSSGAVTAMAYPEGTHDCVISPGGARALLIGNSSSYEGTHGLWTVLRSVVDLRSDSIARAKIAIGCRPAWSNDGRKFAYSRATEAWSNEVRGMVSVRTKEEAESDPDGAEFLAIQSVGPDPAREAPTRRIHGLRWRPDDRGLVAVVGDHRGLSVVTYAADELVPVSEAALPVEPTARGVSISPDVRYVSFCDFPSGDAPDDDGYSGFIYDLTDGRVLPIGPQCLDTRPVWSPTGRWLACRGAGPDSVAITDPAVREWIEIAPVNSDDESGEITGPDPAWSPDGERLAFASYEEGGSAILIADVSSGTCAKILQTTGVIQSIGFASPP